MARVARGKEKKGPGEGTAGREAPQEERLFLTVLTML